MFSQSARVYDRLLRHKDYAAAAQAICGLLVRYAPGARSLLDVACGTGQHLLHLRQHFVAEGLDLSPEMLAIARARLPGILLHQGDLVRFELSRTFDVVTCLFGSIGYATTVGAMRQAIHTMARHLRRGGLLVLEPWLTTERFVAGSLVFDQVDDADLKVARIYVTRRDGRLSVFDSDYLVATADGVTHFREHQELGLFTAEEYQDAMEAAGLEIVDGSGSLFGYGLYVARTKDQLNG
jgi:dTDP-3-amino-3,4,6-trideoxy-alpha-D-glucopyranose N,N-dimethyltransferase